MKSATDSEIREMINSSYIQQSQSLKLWDCVIWLDVLKSRDWSKLIKLTLSSNKINDNDLQIVFEVISNRLQNLQIGSCLITGIGMKILLSYRFQNMRELNLNYNYIGNNGVKYLVKSNLPNLRILKIVDNDITGEGLKHITKSQWPSLVQLHITFSGNDKWETVYENNWKYLKLLGINQKQPICLMQSVLALFPYAKLPKITYPKYKKSQRNSIRQILYNKKLLNQSYFI